MEPGDQPSGAPRDGEAEPQQQAPARAIEGHGQVLILSEFWKRDECALTLQDILEQTPINRPTGPSSIRATSGHSSSSDSSRRRPKRSSDSPSDSADCPAAKSKRSTRQWPRGKHKAEKPREREQEAAAAQPDSAGAEDAAPPARDPPQPRAPREPGARLLLVLCRASALRSQLPRLQLLLQQVRARHRCPPAALVGIVVQPLRDEEAEARRRMEALLRGVFAARRPAVEVHTAVFSPYRPEGILDFQRAAGQAPKVATRACVPVVDQGTQTDGEEPEGEGWERQRPRASPPWGTLCTEGGLTLLVPGADKSLMSPSRSPSASAYLVWG